MAKAGTYVLKGWLSRGQERFAPGTKIALSAEEATQYLAVGAVEGRLSRAEFRAKMLAEMMAELDAHIAREFDRYAASEGGDFEDAAPEVIAKAEDPKSEPAPAAPEPKPAKAKRSPQMPLA